MYNIDLTEQLLKCIFSKNQFKTFEEILDYILERRYNKHNESPNGDSFNFFPSDEKGKCTELAYFVSISDKKVSLKANQKIKFDVMMQNFIRHCQGSCMKTVKRVIIITDKYDIPLISLSSKNDKLFNIFFHMLGKEDKKVQKKSQKFLEKIFNVKELNKIC